MVPLLVLTTMMIAGVLNGLFRSLRPALVFLGPPLPASHPTSPRGNIQRAAEPLFHPGHTWARPADDGTVAAGPTTLAVKFVGTLAAVELPPLGRRIQQGAPAWTLVSAHGRRLTQVMPVTGTVAAVNRRLYAAPELIHESPYGMGWAVRVRPERLAESLANLMSSSLATTLANAVKSAVSIRTGIDLGMKASRGVTSLSGFGDLIDDLTWETLKRDLFSATCVKQRRR